jgi:pterin-4a-carbinolamine dehydratase
MTQPPEALADDQLRRLLAAELASWTVVTTPLPEKPGATRAELYREFRFQSFRDAMAFMARIAPFCDATDHHPRWENAYRTLRVWLTTWDAGQRVTDRDVALARHIDHAFDEFAGRA